MFLSPSTADERRREKEKRERFIGQVYEYSSSWRGKQGAAKKGNFDAQSNGPFFWGEKFIPVVDQL